MLNIFNVIFLPNISITREDMDEYEDEPDMYIKNDLEESDSETRRRLCMKFLQSLTNKYREEVNALISRFVTELLQ